MQKRENPWWNLIFNIALPILILNKGGEYIGPTKALILAILFPLAYGLHDLFKTKKINWISVLGLLNVALTGGFALSGKTGIWFAFKEAAFPLLIGVFVWASSFTKKPALGIFLLNPQAFQIDKMMATLDSQHKHQQFNKLVRRSTQYLSGSFLVSAGLNFGLAYKIFSPIDSTLAQAAQEQVLNEQIAEMTKWSFIVILIPSMVILLALILYFGKRFKAITGESLDNFFHKN
ncbi:MAG: VC0807 family protein [Bdellovibrionales bacterium]